MRDSALRRLCNGLQRVGRTAVFAAFINCTTQLRPT
jgi:hypothetical protein